MQPRPDPRRRFVVTNAEQPALGFNFRSRAPAGDKRSRQRRVEEIDRDGIVQHAAGAGRRYRPAVGAAIPVEPFRDFRVALTKPARRLWPALYRHHGMGLMEIAAPTAGQ